MKTKRILLLLPLFLLITFSGNAQMYCRSMLGAHLTPFTKDGNLLWALEATVAPGVMSSPVDSLGNTILNGGMLLGALDYSFMSNKSHLYIEGGFKNWTNSEFVDDSLFKKSQHFGMRQAFYSYSTEGLKLKVGLHETRLGDFFLIDERVLGVSIDKEIGAFTINARGGTVTKSFARMGKFCANRHLYSLVNKNFTEQIGSKVGETNLVGLAINWDPHYKKSQDNNSNSEDEFAESDEFNQSDEFHENHDFNEFGSSDEFLETETEKEKSKVRITNVGVIIYDEFGSDKYIPDNKFYTGFLVDIDFPFGIFMQTGSIYQSMKNNNTFVYIAKFGKSQSWDNGSLTKLSGAYIGKTNIDNAAVFQPIFSNLFIGEVMRMDATEFPLWQLAFKHRFPGKLKLHFAIKAVGQLEDARTNEQDIEFGILAFNKHLKITLIGSRVETLALPNEFYMARVEMRLAF